MCVSTNFIEEQAYDICEKIKSNSIYHFVRVDYTTDSKLIKEIVLRDEKGTLFSLEPNTNALRFATGEITYTEYLKLQKKDNFYEISLITGILGFFTILMFSLFKFVL